MNFVIFEDKLDATEVKIHKSSCHYYTKQLSQKPDTTIWHESLDFKSAQDKTKTIASKSNLTIKIGKQAFYKQLEMPLKKAYAYTSKMMTINMMAMDAKEGISAFLEKRTPKWKNK